MPSIGRSAGCALAFALALSAAGSVAADTAVARAGQTCPDTGGGFFWQFGPTRVTDSGSVAFQARCRFPNQGGYSPLGFFARDGDTLRKLVFTNDPAPGPPGTYFVAVQATLDDIPAYNGQGELAFEAVIRTGASGPMSTALFRYGTAGTAEVVRAGDPLPAPLTGTFLNFGALDLSDAGVLVFQATTSSPVTGIDTALFRVANGEISVVAAEGLPVPGGSGELWDGFGSPTVNVSGDIAFLGYAGILPGSVTLVRSGETQRVVRGGDVAPGTGGKTFTGFNDRVTIDDLGGVVFLGDAYLWPDGPAQGVFRYADGEVAAVALRDGPAPPPGLAIRSLSFQPSVSRSGRVVMPATVETAAGEVQALLGAVDGHLHTAQLAGDAAPGGGAHAEFSNGVRATQPSIDSLGRVAFNSTLDDGSTGVFLSSLGAQVPAVGQAAWLATVAALLISAACARRRMRS